MRNLRLWAIATVVAVCGFSCFAGAQEEQAKPYVLWRSGADKLTVKPTDSFLCNSLWLTHGGKSREVKLKGQRGANCAESFDVVWSKGRGATPDVVLLAGYGDSGSHSEVIAIEFDRGPLIDNLPFGRLEEVKVDTVDGKPAFDGTVDIEFFHGAPHFHPATMALPMRWDRDGFVVNHRLLNGQNFSLADLRERQDRITKDLAQASAGAYPTKEALLAADTSDTVEAVLPLMLGGRLDKARDILSHGWPKGADGLDRYWADLCRAIVDEIGAPQLGSYPQGSVIVADAKLAGKKIYALGN